MTLCDIYVLGIVITIIDVNIGGLQNNGIKIVVLQLLKIFLENVIILN